MSNHAAMNRAQQRYDDMAPPEDGPTECEACCGRGKVRADHEVTHQLGTDTIPGWDECEACEGYGWIDEYGNPVNPNETGD